MPPKRSGSQLSTSSTSSNASAGMGAGQVETVTGVRDEWIPNLTPEGLSIDPQIKIYDAIIYLIYCPEHDKIAVTNVERARVVWFPFVGLNDTQTWQQASRNGLDLIIGRKDAEMDAKESAKMAPVYTMKYLNILRIQLPTEKFVTRLTMMVELKKSPNSTFQCCQRSMRINWLRARDILADRIDRIWGPELKNFTKMVGHGEEQRRKRRLITEFSLENSFYHYFTKEDSAEKKLLRASHIKPEHIAEIYENFVEHCYPSFYMSYTSFRHYLIKYGFDKSDPRMPFLFQACSVYNHDFLHFHEVLLGIIAMEPSTKHFTEGRLNFIFKYYDTSNQGSLSLEEFIAMVTDIARGNDPKKEIKEEELKTKIEDGIKSVGMKNDRIPKENLIKAILSNSFKNTENLCRAPKPILPQISRLVQIKYEERSKKSTKQGGFLQSKRKNKGSCIRCRDPNYEYCLHCCTFDTSGRCVKPNIINEQWIEPVPSDGMNQHKYSVEYVFNNSSVPNIFTDMIKEFFNKNKEGNQQIGIMSLREDWPIFARYLTILCEELKGLLYAEDKLIKVNSPAIVIGDLQGSLQDLFGLERMYFQSFPVIADNIIFLGNYCGICNYGVEVITYLFSMKMLAPNKIFLLRGTNEMGSKAKKILRQECVRKYGKDFGRKIFSVIYEIYVRLPFAVIVDEGILCCHSGIPKWTKIEKLASLGHDVYSIFKESPIAYELLVNTPTGMDRCLCKNESKSETKSGKIKQDSKSSTASKRSSKRKPSHRKLGINSTIGVTGFTAAEHSDYLNSCSYDGRAFENFMQANHLTFLIRSHSIPTSQDGFDLHFNNRCVTVFSCSTFGKKGESKCTAAMIDSGNQRVRLLAFETEDPPVVDTGGGTVVAVTVRANERPPTED